MAPFTGCPHRNIKGGERLLKWRTPRDLRQPIWILEWPRNAIIKMIMCPYTRFPLNCMWDPRICPPGFRAGPLNYGSLRTSLRWVGECARPVVCHPPDEYLPSDRDTSREKPDSFCLPRVPLMYALSFNCNMPRRLAQVNQVSTCVLRAQEMHGDDCVLCVP